MTHKLNVLSLRMYFIGLCCHRNLKVADRYAKLRTMRKFIM